MHLDFRYHKGHVSLDLPERTIVYRSAYPAAEKSEWGIVRQSLLHPVGCQPLLKDIKKRKEGKVVIAVSDVTRPIPYSRFLPQLTSLLESGGVKPGEIVILIATGMHRPSTAAERLEMFGPEIVKKYRIIDHEADSPRELTRLDGKSLYGASVSLNRHFLEAGYRITTGLVEPHFMAGYSGGRKTVCPGLVDLATIRYFHGYKLLSDPLSRNGNLKGNPLHRESLSIAAKAGVNFTLNLVLDSDRRLVKAFAGELDAAHLAACAFVRKYACPTVREKADIVISGSGGYPLDATFYQCVKGLVSLLPGLKPGGQVIAFGACREGLGSKEYAGLMKRYSRKPKQFLNWISNPGHFIKDQWELMLQCRIYDVTSADRVHFLASGLSRQELSVLGLESERLPEKDPTCHLDKLIRKLLKPGRVIAAFPEGPYCAPLFSTLSIRNSHK